MERLPLPSTSLCDSLHVARLGWRGRTAYRWTLAGFVGLILAYFGAKFVLELLLERV